MYRFSPLSATCLPWTNIEDMIHGVHIAVSAMNSLDKALALLLTLPLSWH